MNTHKPYWDLTIPPIGTSKTPYSVDLEITGRCNLSCAYCFYADSMIQKKDLPFEKWKIILYELGSLAVQRVILSGGEVFTRKDIFDIIDSVIENRMRYSILSNGTLITEETIQQLLIGKRRIRLDYIQISIDGSHAGIHDLSRPPQSFDRAIHALRLIVQHGLPATVRVTLNRHNIDDLENIARLLICDIGLPGFSTNEAEPMGTARCHGDNILLSPDQRKKAMKILRELNEQYGNVISAQAGPLAMADMVDEIDQHRREGKTGIPGRGTLCSCGGVFSKMAILHDGTMVPCNMLPTLVMGVAGMHPIKEAWLHSPAINALRYRREIPLSSLPTCSDCAYTGYCAGGCPALVMAIKNKLNAIDPYTCYRYIIGEAEYHDLM
ncbi:radical SAM protein [Methanospirillum hungatei]|uniref:radical SAM/SPASM domain-containing protein n=1 Tax=Methanospirillum hungatei TaxID=2203 RepID=UPI0026E934D3|nr:radical SAM protein [Methanospirillum hungatei]MCA1916241.1 radical SAM protein [Methanospirillum hungatei]